MPYLITINTSDTSPNAVYYSIDQNPHKIAGSFEGAKAYAEKLGYKPVDNSEYCCTYKHPNHFNDHACMMFVNLEWAN